ncbi:XdhC family protein [Rhizobium herbae]|uniref:Xanthine dehydrogenase accessory factor n=1 Tax=Rhizobium herbae TaxID=508661 RepID=A0ABS4EU76_9HYPH|nr:XdhC family protein [Rhizobium herbae]MBP1861492.1 xanthine dehydrogenase accessory factor [Rhizobium herbae]
MQKSSPLLNTTPATPYCAIMTDDAETILNYAGEGAESQFGSALVTLVDIRGGASRALGAQMAVRGDGGYCGYVSGGCTEAAVAAEAIEAIGKGVDRYLLLGEGSRFFDIVLPCGGGITLAIHVLKDANPVREVLALLRSRRRVALGYDPHRQSVRVIGPSINAGWGDGLFVRRYRPKARLILCGRGIELDTTTRLATASAFETLSFDGRSPAKIDDDVDQDTAVALLFHDIDQEIPFLKAALAQEPFYLGALGSRRTHEKRCQALLALGYSETQIERIKAPIGMFGPVRDAGALALSVLADVGGAYSNRSS